MRKILTLKILDMCNVTSNEITVKEKHDLDFCYVSFTGA